MIRSSFDSFAIQAIKRNKTTRAKIIKVIGEILHKEVANLCSDEFNSAMKQKGVNCYKNFDVTIAKINGEIESDAPVLLSLLEACLKTKSSRTNTKELVAVFVSILCKHYRPEICLLQKIFSLILYVGYASKQVRAIQFFSYHFNVGSFVDTCITLRFFKDYKKLGCVCLTRGASSS